MSSDDPEQPPPTHHPYGQDPYAAPPPPPYGSQQQPAYGSQPYGSDPYGGQQQYGQQYGQQQYGTQPYGQPYGAPQPGYQTTPPNDGMAVASMVIGIVSLVLMCGYGIGLLGSPAALIMGRISMKRIDRSEGRLGGRGFAQAGFILGIIGTILLVLAIIAVVVIIIAAMNGAFDDSGSSYGRTY